MDKKTLEALSAPFPKDCIKTRTIPGSHIVSYVPSSDIIQRLNEVLDGNWSFEITDHQFLSSTWEKEAIPTEIIVRGKLTIDNLIKEDFGSHPVKFRKNSSIPLSLGNDVKGATTDCLKRCASRFGVALSLYEDESLESGSEKASEKQLKFLDSLRKEKGMSKEDIRDDIRQRFSHGPDKLTKAEAGELITAYKGDDS